MKKENKLVEYLKSIEIPNSYDNILGPEELKKEIVQKFLLTLDEFKNVKKINILDMPIYVGDKDSGIPYEFDNLNLGGTRNKSFSVPTYNYNPYDEEIKFELNEEIDVYSITLSPEIYDFARSLDYGCWITPILYHPTDFCPRREMRIVFSVEDMKDKMKIKDDKVLLLELKKRILANIDKAFENGLETNIPSSRRVFFRVSERSIKKEEKK